MFVIEQIPPESSAAPLMMTIALVVALLGVFALLAYVVYCDVKNRAGEKDLALAHEVDGQSGHHLTGSVDPVTEPAIEPAIEPDILAAVPGPVVTRRRKTGAPPQS